MNSRLTMGLAGLLLVGAVFFGYWGLVLSRKPEPAPPVQPVAPSVVEPTTTSAEDQTRQPVVVLVRDVPPFVPLAADDLALEKLRTAPAGSLSAISQAVGRTPWRQLNAGTWLNEQSFSTGGALARMIHSDERALAVAVDEVIGAAGQLSPGDYVDVVLFLRQDTSNPQQSAQIAVPAMRVLAVGEQLGLANDGQPASPGLSNEEKLKQDQRRLNARTVVLAVPEQLLSRLMLATQVGVLRLAVRSSEEQRLAHYWAGNEEAREHLDAANSNLFQFNQLALGSAPRAPAAQGGAARSAVEVIRGNQVTQQTP
ncbi:Flp pilus assembly protein CpaB [Pseudomonas sp. Eqa60]|uniref:Flp pilus assembly protein CpaB n=1 Tax=Pseudomonas TaxID=286 RepID=UPI001B32C8E9|nr:MULTISPECIES: Flp pilus assembly protein CpaB [Pseudomonas]MBP5102265.1 Flp pilus assembly protein CpaB [Pseudomonas protegens]MBP5127562.1 Flp pilus assembly protein CpaB [Pseudomonas protegens]MBP5145428.1 Flp pilus assembly protein CpaB [Pseudomonas protegens]BCQ66719.1 Flp pilus assembly protein CpaB [Pseudomonas sp. Eqa60]